LERGYAGRRSVATAKGGARPGRASRAARPVLRARRATAPGRS
jgi:hypothetical protein